MHWPEAATNTVESGLMVFAETWFSRDIPDNFTQVDGFSHVRLDRDENLGKTRGGGVCIYIKDSWCSKFAIRDTVCNPDLELLCVTLRHTTLPTMGQSSKSNS